MSTFVAQHILRTLAEQHQKKQESISRKEIMKKINEVKYLSSQKNVPKLSLRKEIMQLEQKLEMIFELEKAIKKQKNQESAKVSGLRRQVKNLQKKLAAAQDSDLQRKVDKLTHLLGKALAARETTHGVAAAKMSASTIEKQGKKALLNAERAGLLRKKAEILRARLVQAEHTKQDIATIKKLEVQIQVIERKLEEFTLAEAETEAKNQEKSQVPQAQQRDVKHTIKFGVLPEKVKMELEKELPLPPPPRVE